MAAVDKFYEVVVNGWTVGGILHPVGVHKGAVQYRYKAPKSDAWLPGSAELPTKLADAIVNAKVKVKGILRARLDKADGKAPKGHKKKAAKIVTKAASKKNGLVKKPVGK
mmetsp:Transcript_65212/g.125916  ORF Transcript_65212/g.125916 Transcript_65212/m.125916 type:complete len:110 (+) Transcript_65212:99-428(+)